MFNMFFGHELLGIAPNCLSGTIKTEAQRENAIVIAEIFNRISNMAVTRIDWMGLPDSVSERFLNQTLYLFGMACFFQDDNLGYLALPCTYGGEFNVYYEPTTVNAWSFGFNKQLNYGDFVLIRQNPTCTPPALTVITYAQRMADTLRTIDVLCKKMKQPFIILCEEKQRQTYLNLIKRITDNEVIILGNKDYDIKKGSIEIVDTRIDTDLLKLWEVYHNYESTLYRALGIDTIDQFKRERLIVDEAKASNMSVDLAIEVSLKELEAACQKINAMYGLDVSVETKTLNIYHEGVGDNGQVYDNPSGPIEDGV